MNDPLRALQAGRGRDPLHGKPVAFASARDAIQAGIGMVHQHFMLIPVMTVAENIVLGMEPSRDVILLDESGAEERVRELSEQFGLVVDPSALVRTITVGQEQRVEILKALFRGADILILDEPTAVLTPQEAGELFAIVRSLKADGKSIIFISHKLNEVLEIADRITVLRRGKRIETVPREGATEASLARAMVGREVLLRVEKPPGEPGDVLLSVDKLNVIDDRGIPKVRDVSFTVRAGEIVGIAGVDGNGQTELIEAITGLRRSESGTIEVAGRPFARGRRARCSTPASATSRRTASGAASSSSSRSPRTSGCTTTTRRPIRRWGWLFPARMVERARRLIKEFDVRGGGPQTRAGGLSGGNQQKVVVAREVARDPKVLVAAQPTRGLDVGAIEFLHRRLVAERDEGRAILLVSLELDEIFSLSDRILVMYEGEIVGEHTGEVSEHQIGLEMVGGREDGGGVTSVDPHAAPAAGGAGRRRELVRGERRAEAARRRDRSCRC